jgi:hypothetical protein
MIHLFLNFVPLELSAVQQYLMISAGQQMA